MRLFRFAVLFLLFGAIVAACTPRGGRGGGGNPSDDDDSAQADDDDATDDDDAIDDDDAMDDDDADPGFIGCSGSPFLTVSESEPNDSDLSPHDLGDFVGSVCLEGTTTCGDGTEYGDLDWFVANVTIQVPVQLNLTWDGTGDMDVSVYDPTGTPILELLTETTTPPETGSVSLTETGDYLAFVGCWTGNASAWALEITASP